MNKGKCKYKNKRSAWNSIIGNSTYLQEGVKVDRCQTCRGSVFNCGHIVLTDPTHEYKFERIVFKAHWI